MSVESCRRGLTLNPSPFFTSSSSLSFNWCDDRLVIVSLCVYGKVLFLVRLLSFFRCVVIVFCRYLVFFFPKLCVKYSSRERIDYSLNFLIFSLLHSITSDLPLFAF